MATVNIILDTRSKKKDNTYPLKIRIIHNRDCCHVPLGYSVYEKDWNETKQIILSSCKYIENITRLNSMFLKEKQKALEVISKLEDEGVLETLSIEELKKLIKGKKGGVMTFEYASTVIEQLTLAEKHGNASVYDQMKRSIQTFVNGKDFLMKQITYSWLKKYEAWYLSKGNKINGLSVNLRTLRALINRAIKDKLLDKKFYPFDDYKIDGEDTDKRAIPKPDLDKIKAFEPKTLREERAKDYFFLSFYLTGASFSDIANLKVNNISNGRIHYRRKKTKRLHNIKITPQLQEILDKYALGKGREDYILDIINSTNLKEQFRRIKQEMKAFNKTLKKIAVKCGIEANLTSYVSRHSYATLAKRKGVPISVISEAMGHRSEEVTQIYLDSFENQVLDDYNEMVFEDN